MDKDYAIIEIDTTLTDPLAELEVQGLILSEKEKEDRDTLLLPRPTDKFYRELEELLEASEFQSLDLGHLVRRIIAKYEPSDVDMYTIYMLMAMANYYRWIECSDKCINPALMLSGDKTLQRIITEQYRN